MHKIALVICWYGNWPWYFRLFVHSIKFNQSIDFIIITDEPITFQLPSNVIIKFKTLKDLENIIKAKLDLNVVINNPYKLCDFKPAYGFLFDNILTEYDFWGHADCDIIFGNIRAFLTVDLLDKFDLVSVRHDFLTGYFTLFKNTKRLNTLFLKSKDFHKVFTSSEHYCFDETNFHFEEFTNGMHYSKIFSEIESMTHVVKKAHENRYIKAHFDFLVVEGAGGKLKWNSGELMYKNKYKVLLYHLIKFKTICKDKNLVDIIPNSFSIGKDNLFFEK